MRYIVTGANGGMGRAICLALCGQGHEVIGLDINVPEESAGVRYLRADVTDENSVAQAVEAACESGGIDGVIHAAGVYALGSLVEMGESGFLRAFNVNLFGVYRVKFEIFAGFQMIQIPQIGKAALKFVYVFRKPHRRFGEYHYVFA